jgi:hypothetical protein
MNFKRSEKIIFSLFFLFLCLTGEMAFSQQTDSTENIQLQTEPQAQQMRSRGMLPLINNKDDAKGSPFLATHWMKGVVELSDRRRLPAQNEILFFNYDKMNSRLIIRNTAYKEWSYPTDSISGFELMDSGKIYSFEKVFVHGHPILLMPIVRSEKGYCLYKRLFTKIVPQNYVDYGYANTGKKYDEYVDFYQYYLIYPDKQTVKKFFLNDNSVRNAYKAESDQWRVFASQHSGSYTEENVALITESINNKPSKTTSQ